MSRYSKYIFIYFVPTTMFTFTSWVSFLIPPTSYPARHSTPQHDICNSFKHKFWQDDLAGDGVSLSDRDLHDCHPRHATV